MKLGKKLLAFGLLALPAMLSAQWAHYTDAGGWPHSLLDAAGGGWVVASTGNIFKLSNAGQVVWGQRFDSGPPYSSCRQAWSTPDGGYMAAVDYNFGGAATLFKLSASGSVVWEKTYTLANAYLEVSCPTPDGGAILAGRLDTDLLLCRCSSDGEIVWQRSYGTNLIEWATAATVTSDGGILVLGQCAPPETGIADDIWILKLATTGEVEWQKRIGGAAMDLGEQVFQTADGGYLIAGHTASFDTDGRSLFWLLKLSPAGAVQKQMTLNYGYTGWGGISMRRAADGSFIVAFGAVVVTIAEDGTIIREKPYSSGLYSVSNTAVWPTDDGGCLLSMTGSPSSDDDQADCHLLKILPSGEIEWQKVYGSRYSPDLVNLFARAGDGGYILTGTTRSWGSWGNWWDASSFMWIMRTASDGSIGPYYPFVRPAAGSPLDEVSTWAEVAAPVTDTAAVPQSAGLVAEAANIDFVPWGPTELPALGKPMSTLKIGIKAGAGTTSPAAGSHLYATGTEVQISVTPKTDYLFNAWSGNVSSYQSSFSIVMDGDKEIAASLSYNGPPGPIDKWLEEHGCFIATAAYGDPSHPHVKILREFRDRYLMRSPMGRSLVDLYYKYSPPVARFVEKHPVLRALSRASLYPVVAICDLLLKSGTQY